MKSKIDKYLFDLTDKLAFLSLEESKLEGFEDAPENFAIPVFVTDIRAFAGGSDGFTTRQITSAMLYIIGIDKTFRFNDIYRDFLRKVIDAPEAYAVELGMEKFSMKSYKDALVFLRAAIDMNEGELYPVFNYALASLDFSQNSSDKNLAAALYQEAQGAFERVLELKPDDPFANFQMGVFNMDSGNLEGARNFLLKAVKAGDADISNKADKLLKEVSAEEQLFSAESLIEAGEYSKAALMLEDIDIDLLEPMLSYQILYARGFSQKAAGNIEEALESYGKALAINNQNTLLLADMGMCYALLGDFGQALELYLSALDIEKDSVELLNNIAIIYLNMNDIIKAKEYIGYAKSLDQSEEIVDETIKLIRSIEEAQGSI